MSGDPAGPVKDWTKVVAVAIAACAFLAAATSATAAVLSWRTAKASERVARQLFEVGGPVVHADHYIEVAGECIDSSRNATVSITIWNSGRLGAEVRTDVMVLMNGRVQIAIGE